MKFPGKRYLDYGSFIKSIFGERVQKLSLDTGFTCPNRDGTKGYGGCTYCNNNSFNPDYCEPQKSISQQLERGMSFFDKKGKTTKFLAYFQAYTNTYADFNTLTDMYEEALNYPNIVGLVVGTRPDCISDELLDWFEEKAQSTFVALEFGVESTNETTLEKVNRCHTFQDSIDAYNRCKNRGIHLGAHLILGLPGESRETLLSHAVELSKLPIDSLKLHHLQIVKYSAMNNQFKKDPDAFSLFQIDDYIALIAEFIGLLRPDIVIERFISEAPKDLLVAPKWGLKNFEMVDKIDRYLMGHDCWQGMNYKSSV